MTSGSPPVSVVIPLFDGAPFIGRAIRSVLGQTAGDFELLVVDDGSTDEGPGVVEEIQDPRIRLIRQQNAGVSTARNRGIAEARGTLIAFLDADDEWLAEHLETILNLRTAHPQCGAFVTAFEIVDPDGRRTCNRFSGIPAPPWEGVIPSYFRTSIESVNNIIFTSAVAIPREVFRRVGGFAAGVSRAEDIDMWCRIALRYPIAFSSRLGAIYYRGNRNSLSSRRPDDTTLRLFDHLRDACRSGNMPPGTSRQELLEFYNKAQIAHGLQFVVLGEYNRARKHLNKAVSTHRFRRQWLYWYARTFVPMPIVSMLRSAKSLLSGRAA